MAKKPQSPDPIDWAQPLSFGPPVSSDISTEPPLELKELDLSDLPPFDTNLPPVENNLPEPDIIFGSEDVPVGVPPDVGEVGVAPDLPRSNVKKTKIDVSKLPFTPLSQEALAPDEPETISVVKEQEAPAPKTEPVYVNGHGQIKGQPIEATAEIVNRALALAEAALKDRGQQQVMQYAPMTPEQGAHALLTLIDERHVMTLQQIAIDKANGSIAVVIAGILTRIADLENLGDFAFNEAWLNAINQTPNVQIPGGFGGQPQLTQPHQNICEYCRHTFKPITQSNRQRFCCNACGNIAAGRTDEPLPHRADCSTAPGIELTKIMKASKVQEAA